MSRPCRRFGPVQITVHLQFARQQTDKEALGYDSGKAVSLGYHISLTKCYPSQSAMARSNQFLRVLLAFVLLARGNAFSFPRYVAAQRQVCRFDPHYISQTRHFPRVH